MKSLLSPVLLILVGLIGYFYMMPLYEHIGKLALKRDESKSLLSSIENMETRIAELETEYNSFSEYERSILTRLIPRQVTETDLVHDITAMAIGHSLSVAQVEFAGASEEEQQQQQPVTLGEEEGGEDEGVGTASSPPFKEWNATITVEGEYDDFKNFVFDMARNMRISDVSEIGIGDKSGAATGGGEEGGEPSYRVSAIVYSIE